MNQRASSLGVSGSCRTFVKKDRRHRSRSSISRLLTRSPGSTERETSLLQGRPREAAYLCVGAAPGRVGTGSQLFPKFFPNTVTPQAAAPHRRDAPPRVPLTLAPRDARPASAVVSLVRTSRTVDGGEYNCILLYRQSLDTTARHVAQLKETLPERETQSALSHSRNAAPAV